MGTAATALAIAALDVGALAAAGEPTGLALSPDGSMLALGQRRAIDGRVEERLVARGRESTYARCG